MFRPLRIGELEISADSPPLVLAEIGINHGGNLNTAKEMVDAAAVAGCKCVKHQTHIVDDEMSAAARSVLPGNADVSIYEIMRSCALSECDEYGLKKYVESKGMVFLSTPFSRAAADRLRDFDVVAYKIGSGECNNLPLLDHIASFGRPVILSTGMNDMASVETSVALLRSRKVGFALMHTTNLYPTPSRLVRLGAMTELMTRFPDTPVGLSDHTLNNNACLAATALGAALLERHFTDSKNRSGPDIACSMDDSELKALLAATEEISKMRGGRKEHAPEEEVTMRFAFASVVAIRDITAGETFSLDNIWVKRPGTGAISASRLNELLGCKALRDIRHDEQLDDDMVESL